MPSRCYRFGRYRVLASVRELRDGDVLLDLPARAFDCLVYLIEHRERAIGRDELIAAVWGRADVSEALLNHTILKIRRVLGGDGQALIRTVPRFGYRWAGALDDEAPAQARADEGRTESRVSTAAGSAPDVEKRPVRAEPARSRRVPLTLAGLLIIAVLAAAFALRRSAVAPETRPTAAASVPALPAMVLSAEIDAPQDWAWLRFGVMDLVANHLRGGALRTVPSESVVAMLKQRTRSDGATLLADASLAQAAALRVLPRVRQDGDRWMVTLDAAGMQRRLSVDASAQDPIAAAREAANGLLVKLGHAPGASDGSGVSPALDDLLQRSGAAMLADQLAEARAMIERAAPELRDAPAVVQRLAQIELRAGDYDAVERRLLALLDRLDPHRDAALRARALITLASAYVRRDAYEKADEAYAEAIGLRVEADDPEVLGIAWLGRGIALAQKARFDDARAALGRARIDLETAGDALGVAQVEVNLGDFEVMRHRPADALPILRSAARRFDQLGAREGRVYASSRIADVELELLDPAAALGATGTFWPPESNTSNPRMRWTATRSRAEALLANGRLAEAQALVERIRTESDPQRDAALRARTEALAADLAMRRGDAREAARLAGIAAAPVLHASDATAYVRAEVLEARALAAAGEISRASDVGRRLREAASASPDDGWLRLQATLAEAEIAWATDRPDAALVSYAAAMRLVDRAGGPRDLVAVGAPYADALIEIGHVDEAREVAGRIATWADREPRAAWTQVHLFRALGRADAEREARAAATRLGGEAEPLKQARAALPAAR